MLAGCKLYVVIDRALAKDRSIEKIAEDALRGGADIIQLRDKSSDDKNLLLIAKKIKDIARRHKRLFIINDRADIAAAVDADGVHLGQEDIPVEEARKIVGKKIIGVSTHSAAQAMDAQKRGADYIAIGPVFKTATKKNMSPIGLSKLNASRRKVKIPFFAIGGICLANIEEVKKAGAGRIAVVSAAIKQNNVRGAVKRLKKAITI